MCIIIVITFFITAKDSLIWYYTKDIHAHFFLYSVEWWFGLGFDKIFYRRGDRKAGQKGKKPHCLSRDDVVLTGATGFPRFIYLKDSKSRQQRKREKICGTARGEREREREREGVK